MVFSPVPVANYAQLLAAQAVAAKIADYAPVAADSGRETQFEGAGVFPCLDASAWGLVWDRHMMGTSFGSRGIKNMAQAPAVDFKKDFVLALFAGPTRSVVGYRAVSGYEFGKTASLRLVPVTDQSKLGAVAVPSPWAIFVLPRTKAVLKVEMLVNGRWSTVASVKPTL